MLHGTASNGNLALNLTERAQSLLDIDENESNLSLFSWSVTSNVFLATQALWPSLP
jgi:hypothetical protein